MSAPKLAIVCAGGGMSCVYCGGALEGLARELGVTQPDFLLAASGGAGSSLYYLTGQFEEMRRIWTVHLASRAFFSYRRFSKIMDVDYLVDVVIKHTEPLDLDALRRSATRYFIPVKNASTGEGRFISRDDGLDLYEVLRATKALPVFYGKKVPLDGAPYVDSAFRLTKEDSVTKAIGLGATHILVIEINGRRENPILTGGRKILTTVSRKKTVEHPPEANIFRVRPHVNPATPLTRDSATLATAYDLGYADVKADAALRSFLAPFIAGGQS